MEFEVKNHLLYLDGKQVPFYNTPNKSGKLMTPEFGLVHYTADSNPKQTIGWFMDDDAAASAHLLGDRDGKVYQFGKFNQVLWHAGESEWLGKKGMNSRSIGYELTNKGRTIKAADTIKAIHKNETEPAYWQTYTDIQIEVCNLVTQCLSRSYSLKDWIGHEDVSPIRKSDPGPAFPWDKIKEIEPVEVLNIFMVDATLLNLRATSNVNGKILAQIPGGVKLVELKRLGVWSQVKYSGLIGWVSNKYLTK